MNWREVMRTELLLLLSALIILSIFISLTLLNTNLNRSGALSEAPISKTLENLKNSSELYLIYIIPGDERDSTIYQCGVDIVTSIGYNYGKFINQAYVFTNDTCYYNNIRSNRNVCETELFSRSNAFYVFIDYSFSKGVDTRNRALIINPLILENCSDLIK
ncbi:MAG: hypothetical protein QXD88_01310 [Candidatus Anstonellales archaeon]